MAETKLSNIEIYRNGKQLEFGSFNFPAGEVGVKLDLRTTAFCAKTGFWAPGDITIVARIQKSNDLIELMMITDALREVTPNTRINLFLPYMPGGRQDRRCVKGEAFSLKVYAGVINSLRFGSVITVDPHSDVTVALLENVKVVTQLDVISKFLKFANVVNEGILISPDSGSNKKVFEIAKYFNMSSFVRADKLRNLSTGDIIETLIYKDDFEGKNVICPDDLIEGGLTFIKLAEACKKKNCGKFILYASHGILSKGVDHLLNNGIDEIYTTNSYRKDLIDNDRFHVFKLENDFVFFN